MRDPMLEPVIVIIMVFLSTGQCCFVLVRCDTNYICVS